MVTWRRIMMILKTKKKEKKKKTEGNTQIWKLITTTPASVCRIRRIELFSIPNALAARAQRHAITDNKQQRTPSTDCSCQHCWLPNDVDRLLSIPPCPLKKKEKRQKDKSVSSEYIVPCAQDVEQAIKVIYPARYVWVTSSVHQTAPSCRCLVGFFLIPSFHNNDDDDKTKPQKQNTNNQSNNPTTNKTTTISKIKEEYQRKQRQ